MDARYTQPHPDASMDPSVDPRVNRPPMSLEAGPSRCHMETSFYNILHSSGFAEWAARAEEQNERLRTGTWTQKKDADSSPSADSKSSVESSSSATATTARPAHRLPKRATRSRKLKEAEEKPSKTRSTRSKRSDMAGEEDEEEEEEEEEEEDRNDSCPAETFVARYSNYSSMDTELNILTKHLMQHGGC